VKNPVKSVLVDLLPHQSSEKKIKGAKIQILGEEGKRRV
jgi:hypothetical protein